MTMFVVSLIVVGWIVLMVLNLMRKSATTSAPGAGLEGRKPILPQVAAARMGSEDGAVLPVVSTDLGQAATLFVEQLEQGLVSANLVLWKPSEDKTGVRTQDKQLSLCMFPGSKIEHQMIDDAVALAQAKLASLRVDEVVDPTTAPATFEAQASNDSVMAAPQAADQNVKLFKMPQVSRGTIIEMGKMDRPRGDATIRMYGVKFRTEDGSIGEQWGDNLRTELRAADAKVGDVVEIIKLGRKTIEAGKAPMSLYKVTKLPLAAEMI